MKKAEKLFQLANLVRSKQPITAEKIAEELDVSVRTVYRYIDDISISGIPIYGTTGIGYKLDEQFELPPLNLTEIELEALILGVQMVCAWTSNSFSNSARSLSHKIEAVAPTQLKAGYQKSLHVPRTTEKIKEHKEWELVHSSINDSVALYIEYQALDSKYSRRVIYPIGLFFWGGNWTVGSWCTLREEYRDFRLDKITTIEERHKFNKTNSVTLSSYMASRNNSSLY